MCRGRLTSPIQQVKSVTSVQKITINLQPEKNNGDSEVELHLPLSNWKESRYSLDFHSKSHEQITHALQSSKQMVFGLTGNDSPSSQLPGNTIFITDDEDSLSTSTRFEQRLVSDCSSILLKRHCDKIIMSTALVKNRGEKQLFLATDFLLWTDPESGAEQLAPLILYPVQLFYNDREPDSSEGFLLYADAHSAVENTTLIEKIRESVDTPIANFDNQNQQAFLLSIAVALQSSADISISRKIGINVLAIGGDDYSQFQDKRFRRKSDRNLDYSLAYSLLKNKSAGETRLILGILDKAPEELFNLSTDSILPGLRFRDYTLALASMGLGNLGLKHVANLPDKIDQWSKAISAALQSEILQEWNSISSTSIKLLAGISDCIHLLEHAPADTSENFHPDHAYRNSLPTLQRAKFQHRLITVELDSLSTIFNLTELPQLEQIKTICEVLDDKNRQERSLVDTGYFHARKNLATLFNNGTVNYGEQEELHLKRLIKILRLRELFINNSEYKLTFGRLFNGMKTNWRALESSIIFSRQIADKTGDEALAAHILEQWNKSGFELVELSAVTSEACQAVNRLTRVLQLSTDSTSKAEELLIQAKALRTKLKTLLDEQSIEPPFSALNAQTVLDTLGLVEESRKRFQTCEDDSQKEEFRKRVHETLSWLEGVMSKRDVKTQEVELLLNRMSSR